MDLQKLTIKQQLQDTYSTQVWFQMQHARHTVNKLGHNSA